MIIVEPKYICTSNYLITLSTNLEIQGPDKRFVEIIASCENLADAKKVVQEHANLIMDNDKQCLTIYKIDLEPGKVYDFYRSDLKEAVKKAHSRQLKANQEHMKTSKNAA